MVMLVGVERGVESGGYDALILGDQIVGILMKIGDAAYLCRAGHHVVALRSEVPQQRGIFGVSFDEPVVGMVLIALFDHPVLREVVDPDDPVPLTQQLFHQVAGDESSRARDEYGAQAFPARSGRESPMHLQTSMTVRPGGTASPR